MCSGWFCRSSPSPWSPVSTTPASSCLAVSLVRGQMLCLWTDLNLRSLLTLSFQLCLRLLDILLYGFWILFSALLSCCLRHPKQILLLFVQRRGLPSVYFQLLLFFEILPEQFVVEGSAALFLLGGVFGGTMSAIPFLSFKTSREPRCAELLSTTQDKYSVFAILVIFLLCSSINCILFTLSTTLNENTNYYQELRTLITYQELRTLISYLELRTLITTRN